MAWKSGWAWCLALTAVAMGCFAGAAYIVWMFMTTEAGMAGPVILLLLAGPPFALGIICARGAVTLITMLVREQQTQR